VRWFWSIKGAAGSISSKSFNRRGALFAGWQAGNIGPYALSNCPALEAMQDDLTAAWSRSSSKEALIKAQRRAISRISRGAWLRRQALAAFSSSELDPALVQAAYWSAARAGFGIP